MADKKICLQYLNGSSPTPGEAAHKKNLEGQGWTVRQRNGRQVGSDERVETSDVVAVTGSKVPAQYKALHPGIDHIAFDAKAAEKKAGEAKEESFDTMTVVELKDALNEKGVEFAPNAKKAELIALLEKASSGSVLE